MSINQEGLTDLLPCNGQCGGDYPLYSFAQTDKDVTVTVPLPNGTKAKSVTVDIAPSSLLVGLTGADPVLNGKLFKPIKSSESTWYLDNGNLIVILVKGNLKYEEWWPHVVEGERQIDMKTLKPPELHVSELDEGAQAKVAQMMLEQQGRR
ncbi:NUDC-like protein [Angomonas deanei]|uniref:CS domain containing protein, putative n=1 Tax=Angomonas deanei TaxID=59799 RepID=S9VLN9_9TRYP|eukprot:EPY41779.1 NUDC-like protein [Angomonas deanei]